MASDSARIHPCSGGRIVDDVRRVAAQIARAEWVIRNVLLVGVGLMIHRAQVVDEEEDLVALDRPANIAADIVIRQMPYRRIEERSRIKSAVLQKFIRGALDAIGARFDHHVGHGAGGASQFRDRDWWSKC